MFDSKKRQSLLKLGGLVVVPVAGSLPSIANSAATNSICGTTDHRQVIASADEYELHIELLLDDAPRMRITNTNDKTVMVSQIRPGIVHAGKYAYNLNAELSNASAAIDSGLTKSIPIAVIDHASKDRPLDESLKRQPLRVAMVTADTPQGRLVHSTRAFYS